MPGPLDPADLPVLTTQTPAVLLKLGTWVLDDDRELPRRGYGFYEGMSPTELCDSTRAWWHLNQDRASDYRYAVAIFDGVVRGVWDFDHSTWRLASPATARRLGKSTRRWAVELRPAPSEIDVAFIGKVVPNTRADGRRIFGSGSVVGYWPR